jgi:hypothetical protein
MGWWWRLWKPPHRDQYGLWAGVGATLVAVGLTLVFADLGDVLLGVGILCLCGSSYVIFAIFVGLPLPPTHADVEAYKQQRHIDFLALRDVIWEVHTELETALGQMGRDLAQGTYSGVVPRQDKWVQYAPTIKNDPVFADVKDVIETSYEAIGVHSERSYDAGTGAAGPEINRRDLRHAFDEVEKARDAAARKLAKLGIDQP